MPEFWTWWSENGPAMCTSSPSESARATTSFVSWSAATAAAAIAARPTTGAGRRRASARRPRSAAARSSTSRRGRRAAAARGGRARSPRAASRRRCRASSRAPPRAARRDRLAAHRAGAVRAGLDPAERGVDLAQQLARVLLEPLVELAVVGVGRRVGEVVVGVRDSSPSRPRAMRCRVAVLDRSRCARGRLELRAEAVGVDAHAQVSFLPAGASRRRSLRVSPASSTILSREAPPDTSATVERGTASVSERSSTTASLARPRSGAAATRTFQASP